MTTAPAPSQPSPARLSIAELQRRKDRGERFAVLTSYDQITAGIFESAGIDVLLVGDSAANNVLGYPDTISVTVDELLPLVRAVVRGTSHALVIADLPFGSYQLSPQQALETSLRFMKESGAHAVKFEGGVAVAQHARTVVDAGIPVVGHVGFTPQSVYGLGGYRVQGRGDDGDRIVNDALALQSAGVFAVVLEMVPADLAKQITAELSIPTIGVGAGADCDAQVLVWTDMAGFGSGHTPKFVKPYADLRGVLLDAATRYRDDVVSGSYPDADHSYT
ncbi:MAG: 3-methyl-2-oxobutanoate hydroxymethyltransferase [Actinomycetota bacterium]|jgi:3-methyl-2-oxobutanoate hydroxymethyltransferase|nr:3-methyl-2-oxobutanoate hydroxymethyltransferase [Actinomycetota bacterium]MDQ1541464.1 3-methyl-2-oxobutanoate hydroxymethyltransferase [Actinomycetota bacterium]